MRPRFLRLLAVLAPPAAPRAAAQMPAAEVSARSRRPDYAPSPVIRRRYALMRAHRSSRPFRTFSLLLLLLLALLAPRPRLRAQTDVGGRLERAFAMVDSTLRSFPSGPGFVIGVTDRERTLHVFAHGYADVKTRTPVTPAARFAIGSISKSFTAIALMQLADEGRFDPHAPVATYLPWFQVRSSHPPITGHHLLTHTAGIPRYRADLASMPYAAYALRDLEPPYAPGSHFWYSNTGFQILGYVLEAIERRPYAAIIERRIFAPLGMSSSRALIVDSLRSTMPSYERFRTCDAEYVEAPWFEYRAADGSIVSTAGDMLAYTRLLLGRGASPRGRVLSERAFEALITPPSGVYAYGVSVVRPPSGGVRVSHNGGIAGFTSSMMAHMTDGVGVVMLSNGGGPADAIAGWIEAVVRAAIRGTPLPSAPPGVLPGSGAGNVARFAGTYVSATGASLAFTAGPAGLSLVRDGKTIPLGRLAPTAFCTSEPALASFAFQFETRGDTTVGLTHGPDAFGAAGAPRRTATPVPSAYQAFVGRYESHDPEGSVVRVFARGDTLFVARGLGRPAPLAALAPDVFRPARPDFNPERYKFDAVVEGRALRLTISGMPLYRVDDR